MPYLCEPSFESAATVVRLVRASRVACSFRFCLPRSKQTRSLTFLSLLAPTLHARSQRSRRHIRDAFTTRLARGAQRHAGRDEKPTVDVFRGVRNDDESRDERVSDDDVFTLLFALCQKKQSDAASHHPELLNVLVMLLHESRVVCGDGQAAALAMALFLGILDSGSKHLRLLPFAALANYKMKVTDDDATKARWIVGLATELASSLACSLETSKEVWRGCMNLSEAGEETDATEDSKKQKKRNEKLLRVATLDAATSRANSKMHAAYLLEKTVWFTVSSGGV